MLVPAAQWRVQARLPWPCVVDANYKMLPTAACEHACTHACTRTIAMRMCQYLPGARVSPKTCCTANPQMWMTPLCFADPVSFLSTHSCLHYIAVTVATISCEKNKPLCLKHLLILPPATTIHWDTLSATSITDALCVATGYHVRSSTNMPISCTTYRREPRCRTVEGRLPVAVACTPWVAPWARF